jgi:GH25 family lysozyme M1 (1,4-beta-N-acetylmuramidase)
VWRARRRAAATFLVVATVVPLVPTGSALARDRVPGIDVSTYQRRIDWRAVARSPVRFAIVRASLGNSYVDDHYRRNVAGASAHGLIVGAYHYAKPGFAPWDAKAEARHFLRVARNAPGDVLPVLDIESSGGLSRRQLWRWARRWLTIVRERTGLRAMIYSGSFFWQRYMGNTPWFGRKGYPHWVAHWDVRRPDVPGRRWAGRGWTFWQWSASGRVPGIDGPVDLDWFGGTDLLHGTISSVEVHPTAMGAVVGPRLACGSGDRRCHRLVNPTSELTLRARPAAGARLVGWTGACAAAGDTPTCRLTVVGRVGVSAVFAPYWIGGAGIASIAEAPAVVQAEAAARCGEVETGCALAALVAGGLEPDRGIARLLGRSRAAARR